jgi:hypothetical protein
MAEGDDLPRSFCRAQKTRNAKLFEHEVDFRKEARIAQRSNSSSNTVVFSVEMDEDNSRRDTKC